MKATYRLSRNEGTMIMHYKAPLPNPREIVMLISNQGPGQINVFARDVHGGDLNDGLGHIEAGLQLFVRTCAPTVVIQENGVDKTVVTVDVEG